MAMQCVGNKNIVGGLATIHIVSEHFTKRDIRADITSFDPRTEFARPASTGRGHVISEKNSYVEFELTKDCGLSLMQLSEVCNATVSFRLADGSAYALRQAVYASEDIGFTSEEGKIPVRFESAYEAEEQLGC